MDTVTLKNGATEAENLVKIVMMSLSNLIEENPIAFYELTQKARNPRHEFFGNTRQPLASRNLIDSGSGSMHDSIRNIVLSAVSGDGLEMTLGKPRQK